MRAILFTVIAVVLALAAPAFAENIGGVLVLGDSNAEGPFGAEIYNSLRALHDPVGGEPLRVTIYAKCGAGANDWTSREYAVIDCGAWTCDRGREISSCHHFMHGSIPPLPELYATLNARRTATVIILGLNMIIGNRQEKIVDAERLIRAVHDNNSTCIWVGPPQAGDGFVSVAKYESFIADLRDVVTSNGCRYISSADKTDRRVFGEHSRDDHFDRDDAVAWADRVLGELNHPVSVREKSLLDALRPAADAAVR